MIHGVLEIKEILLILFAPVGWAALGLTAHIISALQHRRFREGSRYTRDFYCTNMARSGMNPKTLQYLMGHSDIGVTMNTYTHLGLDAARDEMVRMEELEQESMNR